MQNKQQQLLIDHVQGVLSEYDEFGGGDLDEMVYRIALEKLTAPEPVPIWWVDSTVKSPPFNYGRFDHDIPDAYLNCVETVGGVPLYAAPVVLEDVLPGEYERTNDFMSYHSGWNAYRAEILRRVTLIESGQWKLVPVEPTSEMMLHNSGCQHHAWDDADCSARKTRQLIWGHMLAAAPEFGK